MADDKLKIVATVEDQFTGPLGKLQKGLKGVGDETAKQGAAWKKDWEGARTEVAKFQGVLGGFTPILSAVGVGSFGAVMSITGITSALKAFTGNTQGLSIMARETGVTIDKLRAFGELGERFGVSADAMKSSVSSFATTMYDLRRRWGEAYTGLQAMNLGKLAEDLVNAPNMEAALKRAMDGLQAIPEPEVRRRVSRMLFGTEDVGRVAASIGGDIGAALDEIARKMGRTTQEQVEAAQRFERSMSDLRANMEGLKTGALTPLIDEFNRLVTYLNRPESVSFFKGELDRVGQGLKDTAAEARHLMQLWERFKGVFSDDVHAPPAFTKKAPAETPGGPSEAEIRRGQLEGRKASVERQKQLLERNPDAADYQRKHDRMVDELKRVGDELQRLREQGGATVSPSSYGVTGTGGGSLIQKAAWGGGLGGAGIFGGPGGGRGGAEGGASGGGSGGSSGAHGGPNLGEGLRGRPFGSKSGTGGGQFTSAPPAAAGTYRPQRQLTDRDLDDAVVNTIAGEARLRSDGGADAVINNMFNRLGTRGWGPSGDLHDVARAPGQYAGYRRATPAEAQYIRDRIKAIASGGVPDNTKGSNSFRASWYRGPWWKRHGRFGRDVAGNTFAFDPSVPNGPYAPYAEPKVAEGSPKPQAESGPDRFQNGAPKVLKPKSMASDPRVPGVVMDPGSPADGGPRQIKPWTKVPALAPTKASMTAEEKRQFNEQYREQERRAQAVEDAYARAAAAKNPADAPQDGEDFPAFLKRRAKGGAVFGQREDEAIEDQHRRTVGGMNYDLDRARQEAPDGETETNGSRHYADIQGRSNVPAYKPQRELTLDEIRKFRRPDPKVGDALMDRFYGKGAIGGGPAMQMPGGSGAGGKGKLDIHLHGFPAGSQARASMDDLFKETSVSKGRPQMDLERA